MAKTKIIDQYGKEIELEDGEIIPDQCGVRVSSFLMDGVQREIAASVSTRVVDGLGAPAGHRPGHVYNATVDEAPARAAYAAHKKYLADAWRTPTPTPTPVPNDRTQHTPVAQNVNDAAQAYAEMVKRTENAWRTT